MPRIIQNDIFDFQASRLASTIARLGKNSLAKYVERKFRSRGRTTIESVEHYLSDLGAPYFIFKTCDYQYKYDDQYMMVFASTKNLEKALIVGKLAVSLHELDPFSESKSYKKILGEKDKLEVELSQADYTEQNALRAPSLVFIFRYKDGDVRISRNYRFDGVYNCTPHELML